LAWPAAPGWGWRSITSSAGSCCGAPEAFWIALAATALIAADILAEPVGRLDSSFVQMAELGLTVLTSFLVGRNAALRIRSRDIPQHDL
jgi:hypothetical protein